MFIVTWPSALLPVCVYWLPGHVYCYLAVFIVTWPCLL